MSPTIFSPGAAAVKSRFTRSGIGPAAPWTVVAGRHGLGWQATRPSWRISLRTSSAPAGTPQRASCAAMRRYPDVPSESSNAFVISSLSRSLLFAVALSGRDLHS
jgi:hypothetical protein